MGLWQSKAPQALGEVQPWCLLDWCAGGHVSFLELLHSKSFQYHPSITLRLVLLLRWEQLQKSFQK